MFRMFQVLMEIQRWCSSCEKTALHLKHIISIFFEVNTVTHFKEFEFLLPVCVLFKCVLTLFLDVAECITLLCQFTA